MIKFLKKNAFTLSEVLIVLSIIGIIAALTIPNLIQKFYEKRVVSRLNQTYAILVQAFKMAEEEYGGVPSWNITETSSGTRAQHVTIIADRLKPFLKVANDCGLSDNKYICLGSSYHTFNSASANYATQTFYYKMKLMNGVSIGFRGGTAEEEVNGEYIDLFVDVNGSRKPNIVGQDLFTLIYVNNKVLPDGFPNTLEEGTCNKKSAGWGCAYEVIHNKNMDYLHK
jgi:prepilin-type N-terminal cleavage/methylation domain-containing protein